MQLYQEFKSLHELRERWKVVLPKPYDWHLTEPVPGEVVGLPTSRGVKVATNGIIVAIQQKDELVFGHLSWFVEDKDTSIVGNPPPTEKKPSRRTKSIFSEF